MRDENQLTLWTKPDDIIKSGYGTITYREWCERERERINRGGGNAEVVTRQEDGFVALFRVLQPSSKPYCVVRPSTLGAPTSYPNRLRKAG